jgi:hypothetical protein
MPTHLYCLLPPGSSAVPPAGIRVVDAPLARAWVADATQPRLSRDARDAARATVEHDRVIGSALAQDVTPMPASLADPYDDDVALLADVAAHGDIFRAAFMAIAGMVEMTAIISLQDAPPPPDAAGRGKTYLEQIRSAPDRAAMIADRIAASLSELFVDSRRRGEGGTVALSHLMPRSAIDLYRTLSLSHAGEGYRLVVDGPRAPYSFALYSPRRGLVTEMWLGEASVKQRHESGDLKREP